MMAMAMLMVTVRMLTTIMMAMAMMMVTSYWCQGPLWSPIPLTLSLWQLLELHSLLFSFSFPGSSVNFKISFSLSWQLDTIYNLFSWQLCELHIIYFFSWQFGELHNLLHLRGEVPQSASSEGGWLQELPSSDPFKSTPGVAQSRGFDSFFVILISTNLSQTKTSTHLSGC